MIAAEAEASFDEEEASFETVAASSEEEASSPSLSLPLNLTVSDCMEEEQSYSAKHRYSS